MPTARPAWAAPPEARGGLQRSGQAAAPPLPPVGAELGSQAGPCSPPAPGSAAPLPPPPPRGVTRPAANRGSRGGGPEGSWAEPGRPLSHGLGAASPENFSPNCPGNVRGREGKRGSNERLEDRGPLRRIRVAGELPLPPPKAPNPSRSQTFPRSSSPRPREPAIQGMENSGRRSAESGGEREGGRAAGRRRTGVGLALPHSLIFFFFMGWGWAAFW